MELSVPTNWQEDLLLFLLGSSPGAITEVYGKLYLDAVGGGRVASALYQKVKPRNIFLGCARRDINLITL